MVRPLAFVCALVASLASSGCGKGTDAGHSTGAREVTLLNVSYDPTRELYADVNASFAKQTKEKSGTAVTIRQSHGGSGKQARAVIDGLDADVVTLALALDIDAISDKAKLLPAEWQTRLPNASSPYTSTVAFLVRKGNPKGINGWDDLVRPGVSVVTPNPKTGGGARWNYMAAWGWALKKELGDLGKMHDPARAEEVARAEEKAKAFVAALYANVAVLDSGARGSTTTFVSREIGDVLVSWESEILMGQRELGADKFEIVVPQASILAEPAVAVVDKNADKHGTRDLAQAYLEFLYTEEGQEIAAKHYYRPRNAQVAARHANAFPKTELFTIADIAGDWRKAQKRHFDDGGVFDQVANGGREKRGTN
jgi:sulfate transport system substrate-binding protein